LVKVIVQNKIQVVYPVSWTAVCYVTVTTLFIKKVGVVRPNFGGVRTLPTSPPVVAPLSWGWADLQSGSKKYTVTGYSTEQVTEQNVLTQIIY